MANYITNVTVDGTKALIKDTETSNNLTAHINANNPHHIQVGGRNLLLNSGGAFTVSIGLTDTTWNESTGKSETSLPITTYADEMTIKTASFEHAYFKLEVGGTYTQSITVETDANIIGSISEIDFSWYDSEKWIHIFVDAKITSVGEHAYVISSTHTIGESESGTIRIMNIFYLNKFFDFTTGTYLRFYHPKIERGNIATDWTPAPEDLETTAITNANIDSICVKG